MSRPKKYNIPLPESATDAINAAEKASREAENMPSNTRIPLPNGRFAALELFMDTEYRSGNYTSIFADPHKYMKEVNPECMYAWVAFSKGFAEASLVGKIRSGMYRPVLTEELLDDTDLAITTHRIAGLDVATVYDVALVEVQPRAVKRLYKWREQQAVQKTVRNAAFEFLKNTVQSETGGAARVEMEVKDTNFG